MSAMHSQQYQINTFYGVALLIALQRLLFRASDFRLPHLIFKSQCQTNFCFNLYVPIILYQRPHFLIFFRLLIDYQCLSHLLQLGPIETEIFESGTWGRTKLLSSLKKGFRYWVSTAFHPVSQQSSGSQCGRHCCRQPPVIDAIARELFSRQQEAEPGSSADENCYK